ncbi:hypothetical protein GPECTOR_24g224 [Gonium pectorale]|uniref:Peptidase S8/S53 domain-containing protein n=1 Tax=Gonium pectorale TaxID=33097 RepID=A0A150GGJ4_GONPE|nr:hypothetical protein GPECTOR_24g224 [Gonium pectorale]|eukprot:KXZ48934.1 hypothetical protein GPECTOR_24g224 [Gonium pectorale]
MLSREAGSFEKLKRKVKTNLKVCACVCCLLFALAVAAAIAVPVCVFRGCPTPLVSRSPSSSDGQLAFNLRLLGRMDDVSQRVSDLIPPLLRRFINVTRLEASAIELLDFDDWGVLSEVLATIISQFQDKLSFLIQDFPVQLGPGDRLAELLAAQLAGGGSGSGAGPPEVFDYNGNVWASHVVTAYAYALRMGAHIVSCSFGPNAVVLRPSAFQRAQAALQQKVYAAAVKPLQDRNVLLVAAAGNSAQDLNGLAGNGSNYLPCTLPNANVICVTGTNPQDGLVAGKNGNADVGVNWGSNVVDIAAPGQDVLSTLPVSKGLYGNLTGSSMATPLVAGVAALVASVVGASGNLSSRPNYFQAARVKELVLGSADPLPQLPVRGSRRLNALRALQAAFTASNNSYLLSPSPVYYASAKSAAGSPAAASLLAPGLTEEYYAAPLGAGATAASSATLDAVTKPESPFDVLVRVRPMMPYVLVALCRSLSPFEVLVRVPSANASVTRLTTYAYNSTTAVLPAGTALLLRLSGLLRLNASGGWGVQLLGLTPTARVALSVGKRVIDLRFPATLAAETPGLYDFELLVLNPGPPLELRWARPSAAGAYDAPPADMFVVPSYAPAVPPRHAPTARLPFAPAAAPAWHIGWNLATSAAAQATAAAAASGAALAPRLLATLSPGLAPWSGPWTPLRHTAVRPGLFPAPGAFGAMAVAAATAAAAAPNASSAIVVPDAASTGAFGTAVTHLAPPANGSGVAFQLSCSSCRLFVQPSS